MLQWDARSIDMRTRTLAVAVTVLLLAGVAPAAGGTGAAATMAQTGTDCSFPVTETDVTGTNVTVEESPERVVVLGASAAQTMWEIGGAEQVVGMPKKPYTTYLDGSEERQEVTNEDGTANVERVLAAEPDLVLAANINSDDAVAQLRDAGVTVFKFGFASSIEDVYNKTRLTGRLTGNCEAANGTVDRMRTTVETVEEAVAGEERPEVFYAMSGGYTALPGSFIHDVITTAGGYNVAADLNTSQYGQVSPEVVIDADPDWIVVGYAGERPDDPAAAVPDAYANTTAVREGQVVAVNSNYISQPAPRIVRPLTRLAETFHPEAYAAANGTTTTTATTTTTGAANATATTADGTATTNADGTVENGSDGVTATTEPAGTTGSGGVPGFGPVAVTIAIALGALLSRR